MIFILFIFSCLSNLNGVLTYIQSGEINPKLNWSTKIEISKIYRETTRDKL